MAYGAISREEGQNESEARGISRAILLLALSATTIASLSHFLDGSAAGFPPVQHETPASAVHTQASFLGSTHKMRKKNHRRATEGRDHSEYASVQSSSEARKTRYNVESNAMFEAQDEEHQRAHNTQGVYNEDTGFTSRGVVTLEGVWTQKQLDNFDKMTVREQHEFFNHYNQRLKRHYSGNSTHGGGKISDPDAKGEAHSIQEAHCEADKGLRKCWLQNEQDCSSPTPWGANLRCQWDEANQQCGPKPDVCGNLECRCSGDGTGPEDCVIDCECAQNVLCEWKEAHRKNNNGVHQNDGKGVSSKVHVGPTGEGQGHGSYNVKGEDKKPGVGPKGFKTRKHFRFSRICDLCELFGVDAEDCDATNFRPYVEEQGLVENGNAGFCGATLRTGDMCAIECDRGYYPSSKIACDVEPTGNGSEKAAVANCLSRDADSEGGCDGPPTCIGNPCVISPPENGNFGNCGLEGCEGTYDHDDDPTTEEVPKHNSAEGCIWDPQKKSVALRQLLPTRLRKWVPRC